MRDGQVDDYPMPVATVQSGDAVEAVLKAPGEAEPAAPYLNHCGHGESAPYVPGATASAPWVRKRKAKRRRRKGYNPGTTLRP